MVAWTCRADDHLHPRRTLETVPSRHPTLPVEDQVASRREGGEVGHLRPGRETEDASAGKPRRSSTQRPATSSAAAAAGDMTSSPATWSQVEASQSAATAASSEPPMTYPK